MKSIRVLVSALTLQSALLLLHAQSPVIYSFGGDPDGANPKRSVTLGGSSLYGTTVYDRRQWSALWGHRRGRIFGRGHDLLVDASDTSQHYLGRNHLVQLHGVARMMRAMESLAGKARRAATGEDARAYVAAVVDGKTAVASNAPFLVERGIVDLAGVQSDFTDAAELRALCAVADVGITSADYALADTGTLVMLASPAEARLISLLPPVHIAILPKERLVWAAG